jgi:hypothetical protein
MIAASPPSLLLKTPLEKREYLMPTFALGRSPVGCSIPENMVAHPFREPHCQNYLIGVPILGEGAPTDWGEMSDLGEIPRR